MSDGKLAKHQTGTTLGEHPELYPYVMQHINDSTESQRLRQRVEKSDWAVMMGAPDEAAFLAWLVNLMQGRKVIEVGVFRGSTTLALAERLPEDGKIVALDVSEEYVAMGKEAWAAAKVDHKIDFRCGDAKKILEAMIATPGECGSYDLMFIDANKEGYDTYYEAGLKLLKVGGVVAVDNSLWSGNVLDPKDEESKSIAALNEKIRTDKRVHATMLPVADGLYLCRKL